MRKVIAILLLGILFMGCASMPTPKTGQETLVLIPLDYQRDRGIASFGNYILVIADKNSEQEVARIKVENDAEYIFSSALPPGDYYVKGGLFKFNSASNVDGKMFEFKKDYCKFTTEPGKITVTSTGFQIIIARGEKEGSYNMNIKGITKNLSSLRKDTLKALQEDHPEEFAQWEIAE